MGEGRAVARRRRGSGLAPGKRGRIGMRSVGKGWVVVGLGDLQGGCSGGRLSWGR